MAVLLMLPATTTVIYLYLHRFRSLAAITSGPTLLLLLSATLLALAGRRTLFDTIDRHFFRISDRRETPKRIQAAPGWKLRKFAEFFFSPKTFSEVLEPTLRDLFDDYCKAFGARRPWKARWACIRGYWSFWSAVLAQTPISAAKLIYRIWKAIP
ncbi:MAG TPA: hypothetical protein VLX28_07755 [Thermoanaerobaculia bacterium]|nr:hypothetical protein [Thermoanaerobaculia bacterium]